MSRIVYVCLPSALIAGGAKMIFRHVEGLEALGYRAAVRVRALEDAPTWFSHQATVDPSGPLHPDDIFVVPEDSDVVLRNIAEMKQRKFIFCQNHFYCARGMGKPSPKELASFDGVIVCSQTVAEFIRWRYPSLPVDVVPAFADERRFRPLRKEETVAFFPWKRKQEAHFIWDAFWHANPRHAQMPWRWIEEIPEDEVADDLGRSRLFLSLGRLEGLGMAALEAMASGCLVAGYTGVGGREYADESNGFWVDADDPNQAVRALTLAADLAADGGAEYRERVEAGRRTAARWSHAEFLRSLDAFWARHVQRVSEVAAA